MGKKNKSKKKKQNKKAVSTVSLRQIPSIIGADFEETNNNISELQAKIDALEPRKEKVRILFDTEASFLHTGFSTYLREVMLRLHATGKYELAELGSYGASAEQDPRARQVPWKYYHNLPTNPVEEAEYKKDYRENQFGKWKLTYVLADFQPDIVLLNRDNWMDTHVLKDALRENCSIFWMPTVDGFPQKWDWAKDYANVDGLFTYSWFGKRVLEEQSRSPLAKRYGINPLNVQDVIQPGVNLEVFKPLPRDQVLKAFNIPDPNFRFVGTVMRNQPRKLFPRIIESFRMFKEQFPSQSENVFLLLHTSYPDVGWDIPEFIRQNGLEQHVVWSYRCQACGNIAISSWMGSPTNCPVCKTQGSFTTPSTQFGFEDHQLNLVFNLMDVYIQGTIAEGDGMPINEAKACGVPCLMSDYSACYEKARNGGALPIANLSDDNGLATYTEQETGQNRSLFDRQDLANKLAKLMGNEPIRLKLSREARECAVKYYDWNLTAKKWELHIDSAKLKDREKTWNADIKLKPLPDEEIAADSSLSDKDFIEQCYLRILSGKKPDPEGFRTWHQTLKKSGEPGTLENQNCRKQLEAYFRSIISKENEQKQLKANVGNTVTDPIERVRQQVAHDTGFKILYAIPETFGDVLISTGVIDGIKKNWPEASVYVATQKKHFGILEDNEQIAGLVEYHESMLNYRSYETWGPSTGVFDIVFNPYIVTQRIPHWIHNGHGPWLGQAYANMCNVEFGSMFLAEDDSLLADLPDQYITVQSQTRTDPKDWDYFNEVIDKIKNIKVIHVGAKEDKDIKCDIDLRGRTTIKQVASVIKNAKMHLGGDSLLMHIAGIKKTPSVIVFGGTYKQQGYAPCYAPHVRAIETQDRGPCVTSCHLLECEAKKQGFAKCINNIPVEQVMEECRDILGAKHVEPLPEIKISSYLIIRDGIKYRFPFEEAIEAAVDVSDEVVVVDGGSTDGTLNKLNEIAKRDRNPGAANVVIEQHDWDMDCPTLMGDEKTYARDLCTGTHLIQLDCDEIISEPHPGAIRELVRKHRFADVLDLPCINFYGDTNTIRVESNFWKWRISRNDPNILHGVHKDARRMDPATAQITMDKTKSDSCEYIYEDTLEICNHKIGFDANLIHLHERMKVGMVSEEEYLAAIKKAINSGPVIFHYSWLDLERKQANGEFWDQTFHGKKNATHNTTKDIGNRVARRDEEILLKVGFDHPFAPHTSNPAWSKMWDAT